MAFSLAALAERELRGTDVPGASDNASGAAVAMQLAAECAAAPLEHTEVDLLVTSCEESGLLGAQAYARRHKLRAAETTFLNFDTVGGPAPLTYILREGSATMNRPASESLVGMLDAIAHRRPELGLTPARTTPGLPTDATPMRARGWEAVTLLAQGRHDSQLPLADRHLREHRSAHRRTGARDGTRTAARPRRGGQAKAAESRFSLWPFGVSFTCKFSDGAYRCCQPHDQCVREEWCESYHGSCTGTKLWFWQEAPNRCVSGGGHEKCCNGWFQYPWVKTCSGRHVADGCGFCLW